MKAIWRASLEDAALRILSIQSCSGSSSKASSSTKPLTIAWKPCGIAFEWKNWIPQELCLNLFESENSSTCKDVRFELEKAEPTFTDLHDEINFASNALDCVIDGNPATHAAARIFLEQQRAEAEADLPDGIVSTVHVIIHHSDCQWLVLYLQVINLEAKPGRVERRIQRFSLDVCFVSLLRQFDLDKGICCVVRSVHDRKVPKNIIPMKIGSQRDDQVIIVLDVPESFP